MTSVSQPVSVGRRYHVERISSTPDRSSAGADIQWKDVPALSQFVYPWENETPPPSRFQALHDDDHFYCLFTFTDESPYVHDRDSIVKDRVISSSRAEIFFCRDEKLTPYYCLEVDSTGRVYDYEAHYHRQFNPEWAWPANGLQARAHLIPEGYQVELVITKSSLRQLGLLRNNRLHAGIYRADAVRETNDNIAFRWISWIDPLSSVPDFHVPSSFGTLILVDENPT